MMFGIELYNPTNQSLNLSGLLLVEGSDQWQFPDTASTILLEIFAYMV
ncbi:MAG: hypothetical protein CM15mP44_0610 [Candidatus Neomarinimicrobiota bacterium]|nr:MAG: hypothetical protein CM15mP44_0610 [Candidatus Neomarinimicrobiota bacterium]